MLLVWDFHLQSFPVHRMITITVKPLSSNILSLPLWILTEKVLNSRSLNERLANYTIMPFALKKTPLEDFTISASNKIMI